MIRQIDVMHTRGTGSRSRTDAPWRAAISIVPAIILLFLTGFVERALADSHDNTDELWDLGVRLDGKWTEKSRCGGRGARFRDDRAVFRADQTGSEVTFVYVDPCRVSMKKYGFRKNDVSIEGKIWKRKVKNGFKHTIKGKIRTRIPSKLRKKCPQQKLPLIVSVTGEITVDENFSKIKFTYQSLTVYYSETDKKCIIIDKGTSQFEMNRPISVESIRISQREPRIQGPAKIQLVSRTLGEIPYAKIAVRVEFFKNAVPVFDAYPVDIALNNDPKRTVMARRALSLQGNVYRVPWIKLVKK